MIVIQDPFHNQFLVPSYAFTAKNTFAHIPFEKGVEILEGEGLGHGIQRDETNPQVSGQGSQLTAISFIANDTGFGMIGQKQLKDGSTVFQYPGRSGLDDHPRGDSRYTGRQQDPSGEVFHQTYSAGPGRREMRVMTKGGYGDPHPLGQFQDGCSCFPANRQVINLDRYYAHGTPLFL
jgi:hypothetical protein